MIFGLVLPVKIEGKQLKVMRREVTSLEFVKKKRQNSKTAKT